MYLMLLLRFFTEVFQVIRVTDKLMGQSIRLFGCIKYSFRMCYCKAFSPLVLANMSMSILGEKTQGTHFYKLSKSYPLF